MLTFAVVSLTVMVVAALTETICAFFDAEDLREMGIRE